MEAQGAAWPFFWTSLSLLLISVGAAEVTTSPKIFPMHTPVQLNISKCKPLPTDSVEWKKDNARLCRKRKMSDSEELDKINKCKILSDGALRLEHLEKEGRKEYFVDVHDSKGVQKCSESVTVIGQYPVEMLFMNFTCKDKKKVEVYCSISQGTEPEMILKQDDTILKTGNGKSLSYTSAYKAIVNFTCIAKNKVMEKIHTLTLDCEKEGWDWYLYLAAAAGGVAFIIFIILIIYSVRSCRRPDEETPYNNQMRVMQERQLPQPPGQASAPPPCVTTADEMDYINSQKPSPHRQGAPEAAPEGKKGRRTRPRPPEPPQGQPENVPLNHQCPAPQQTRPALPGNHPSDHQAPRPTPRTKSKPPRQNRKSR